MTDRSHKWRPVPTPKACLARLWASRLVSLPSKMKEQRENCWDVRLISLIMLECSPSIFSWISLITPWQSEAICMSSSDKSRASENTLGQSHLDILSPKSLNFFQWNPCKLCCKSLPLRHVARHHQHDILQFLQAAGSICDVVSEVFEQVHVASKVCKSEGVLDNSWQTD